MPGPRLPMRRIRDVLRLSAGGMSKRQIAASLGVSATAAGGCIRRARRAGLAWPLPDELSDEELERRLYPLTDATEPLRQYVEQKAVVDHRLVLQRDGGNRRRHGEDDMEIGDR